MGQMVCPATTTTTTTTITCVSAYISGSTNFNDEELGRILHELPKPIIIMGDLNAHHTNWGNRLSDRRGHQLQDLCTSHQLNIVNENIPTHVSGTSIESLIVSPDLSPDITWTVASSVLSSDLFPIIILFNIPHPAVKLSEEGWNYRKGKWEEYGHYKVWSHLNDELPDDSHSILEGLYTHFRSTVENCIPKYKRRRFPVKPWWSSECKASWREHEKCYRKFKRTNNMEDKINWKRAEL